MSLFAEILAATVAALAAIPPAEWLAVVLALGYLLLAVRQNTWCWACAIASAVIYLVLFARANLYMQSALQIFYIGMGIYGWHAWSRGSVLRGTTLGVSRWPPARHAVALALALALGLTSGWLIARGQRTGVVPYVDAIVAWGSVLATWLVARKVLENWLYWIAIDIVAAALYWSQGFHATSALFLLYVAIAVRGFLAWRADLAAQGPDADAQAHA